jgi:hypothetical protein
VGKHRASNDLRAVHLPQADNEVPIYALVVAWREAEAVDGQLSRLQGAAATAQSH